MITHRRAFFLLTAVIFSLLATSSRAQTRMFTQHGAAPFNHLGYAVAGLGDVNGDGFDDFAAGSPQESAYQGRVRIYSGFDGSILTTLAGTGSFAGVPD